MPEIQPETTPEAYDGVIPQTQIHYRLTRQRLGDLPIGSLFTRRPPHQFLEELGGVTGDDVVTGLVLRGPRRLDPMLVDSLVWEVRLTPEGPADAHPAG